MTGPKRFYLTPASREFANDCGFAYFFDGTRKDAYALVQEYDCHVTDDPEWIEKLQVRMHLAEGCTASACTCDEGFQEYDEDGEYVESCGFQVQAADEFCDPLPPEWEDWLSAQSEPENDDNDDGPENQDCITSPENLVKQLGSSNMRIRTLEAALAEAKQVLETARKYFPKSIKNQDRFTLLNVLANTVTPAIDTPNSFDADEWPRLVESLPKRELPLSSRLHLYPRNAGQNPQGIALEATLLSNGHSSNLDYRDLVITATDKTGEPVADLVVGLAPNGEIAVRLSADNAGEEHKICVFPQRPLANAVQVGPIPPAGLIANLKSIAGGDEKLTPPIPNETLIDFTERILGQYNATPDEWDTFEWHRSEAADKPPASSGSGPTP